MTTVGKQGKDGEKESIEIFMGPVYGAKTTRGEHYDEVGCSETYSSWIGFDWFEGTTIALKNGHKIGETETKPETRDSHL